MTLTMKTKAAKDALEASVPGYAVLKLSHLTVTLTCNPSQSPYGLTAIYKATPASQVRRQGF